MQIVFAVGLLLRPGRWSVVEVKARRFPFLVVRVLDYGDLMMQRNRYREIGTDLPVATLFDPAHQLP